MHIETCSFKTGLTQLDATPVVICKHVYMEEIADDVYIYLLDLRCNFQRECKNRMRNMGYCHNYDSCSKITCQSIQRDTYTYKPKGATVW